MWATLQPEFLARLPEGMRNGVVPPVAVTNEVRAAEAEGWKTCINAMLDIRLLERDWDGQGTEAPTPEVVDSTIILAVLLRQKHVKPPCHTVQSVQGSVNLHWQLPDDTVFDIDVIEPDVADVFLHRPDHPCEYWRVGATAPACHATTPMSDEIDSFTPDLLVIRGSQE